MAIFTTSEQLIGLLQTLFDRVAQDPQAVEAALQAKMVIRLKINHPTAEVCIDARRTPVQIQFTPVNLSADLDVSMGADIMHRIMMKELGLGRAVLLRQVKAQGALNKVSALEDIFHRCQTEYPRLAREIKLIK